MPAHRIPLAVKRFIWSTINSIDQLEVLLFVMSNAERFWTAEEIRSRIRVNQENVAEKLRELAQSKLVVMEPNSDEYRYAPESPALADEVARSLQQAYDEGKNSLFELIYTRPFDNIRVFSDAFRVRKEDRD